MKDFYNTYTLITCYTKQKVLAINSCSQKIYNLKGRKETHKVLKI